MLINDLSLILEAKQLYESERWKALLSFNADSQNESELIERLEPLLRAYYSQLEALAKVNSFYDQLADFLNNKTNTYSPEIQQQLVAVGLSHVDFSKRKSFLMKICPDLYIPSLYSGGINLLPEDRLSEWVMYRLDNHSQYYAARSDIYEYVLARGYLQEINKVITPIISAIVSQPIDKNKKTPNWQELALEWLALSVGKHPPLLQLTQTVYQTVLKHYPFRIFEYTYYLLPVLQDTLIYIRTPQGLNCSEWTGETQESLLKYLAEFGGPQDLALFKKHFEEHSEDQYVLAEALRLYGNPNAILWMQTQLANEDSHIAHLFQLALLNLFYNVDDPNTKDETYLNFRFDWETYGQEQVGISLEDMSTEQRATLLNQYWMFRSRWIRNNIKTDKRYMDGQLFDLLKYLRQLKYIGRRDELKMAFHNIHTYTGEFFPFDPHANLEVQFAQIKALEDFLEANQERFPVGGWFYQGKSY